jgi:hypothetical protein
MAQLTNIHAAEREPVRFSEGPQPLNRLSAHLLGRSFFPSEDLRACTITSSASLNASALETAFNDSFHIRSGDLDGHFRFVLPSPLSLSQ